MTSSFVASEYAWLELLPLPSAIIRAGRYVEVNEALLQLLKLQRCDLLGERFDKPVAPEDRARVRERHQLRVSGAQVPGSYELIAMRGDGVRRTLEIHVTQSGEDTLFQLFDVTARATRLENLRSLARLGASVQRELSDEAIFRVALEGLSKLGAVMTHFEVAGDTLRLATPPDPRLLGDWAKRVRAAWTPPLRQAWEEGYAFIDDVANQVLAFVEPAEGAVAQSSVLERELNNAAVVRFDVGGQRAGLLVVNSPWVRPEDQAALVMFGAQIGAALDAARAVRNLSERNTELTALNQVAMLASVSDDLAELFNQAAVELVRVSGCVAVALYLLDDGVAYLKGLHGGSEEAARLFGRVPLAGTRLGEVVTTRLPQVWRRADYDEVRQQVLRRMQQEVVASVPMISHARALGVLNIAFATEREVSPQLLDLFSAVATHLAAALEASRLVDDLRRRNDELSQAQAQLVRKERLAALGEMAAAVAHEVRNPLAVIFNLLATLRRSDPPDREQLLTMLTEESERIDHLVSDLLDLARPSLPALTEVGLKLLVEDAVAAIINAEPEVDLRVVDEGALDEVRVDPRLMRQVFVNLAINAVQAMSRGGTLTVRLAKVDREGAPHVQVAFEDTGHGFPEPVLPRVFEPFFTTRARGTGLGLTLVKRFVEAHRGSVTVGNHAGGAVVTVEWPTG